MSKKGFDLEEHIDASKELKEIQEKIRNLQKKISKSYAIHFKGNSCITNMDKTITKLKDALDSDYHKKITDDEIYINI